MVDQAPSVHLEVETMGESGGICDCCGLESRSVWGIVHSRQETVAAYWMHWTEGHLGEPGANLDLVLGRWGDDTTADDRFGVALIHRQLADGTPSLMVIDADARPIGNGELAAAALSRDQVIGTPMTAHVFDLVDAIYEQDGRFF